MSHGATAAARAGILAGLAACCAIPTMPPASTPVIVVASLVLAVMTGWIAWQDASDFTIPDGPLLVIASLGVALRISAAQGDWREALSILVDAGLCGGALLAIREAYYRLKGMDGLGFGDVKLAASGGSLLGITGFAHALLTASALGLAVVLMLMLIKPARRIDRLPFGALLAPACALVWALSLVVAYR
ncbi:hypothetical protein BTR14_09905 [Rhizobium rhizosphaerae]|uniref:Prepilin type IV endopeptidase peptidase domain-containing protein n=1 Tax=Xaviernesmea rhizosphaerae TaxID=1672749 RepID=A0ABX3PE23_9HYPH|nr:A24 family peptidase [Xaviernesmea rhizosphaerae]OQP86741.1 hypothetical protein BTR14_09905 [Xaviernesmea rhizosphaerae]